MRRSIAVLLVLLSLSLRAEPATSKLVSVGEGGRLVYTPWNEEGDRIPDFSTCGYKGGLVAIPDVPAKRTLEPMDGDNRERIQQALDEVAALPLVDGVRGAVLLKWGRCPVDGTLRIQASGVVLRGEGDGEDGTVLVATQRKKHTLISVGGSGRPQGETKTVTKVTDEYVPVGSAKVHVEDASPFSVGDLVIVHRASTEEWISVLGMDRIKMHHKNVKQWRPRDFELRFQRVVVAVRSNEIELDAPIVCALDQTYGGGKVCRYSWPERIENVGIENLRGESEFDHATADKKRKGEYVDENHGWNFVSLGAVRDGWVRNVTSQYFGYSCVAIGSPASRITVLDSACLDPVSQITGGRRYSFAISGQLSLVRNCRTRGGRHDFVMHARVPGPNAFVDCVAEKAYSDSGPHHRWATGTLYDNVVVQGNQLNVQDRQWSGTGHGWAGANMVFWNCTARSYKCQQPPTAQNFGIGCRGPLVKGSYVKDHPNGWWESPDQPVTPRSLYLRQLEERRQRNHMER
jgi:hypothetical protein